MKALLTTLTALFAALLTAAAQDEDAPRALFVLTSCDTIEGTDQPTGFFLSEAAHPFHVLNEAGIAVDFVSPEGGEAPIDPKSMDMEDPINKAAMDNPQFSEGIKNTVKPSEVDVSQYDAIFFAGGHGTMFDFPENEPLQNITRQVYEDGGVVGAVCHGPAALVNVKLSDGSRLLEGKKVAGFTNEEEEAVELTDEMPFLLETRLKELGAEFTEADNFQKNIAVDGRVITGQNPASATAVGEAMRDAILASN